MKFKVRILKTFDKIIEVNAINSDDAIDEVQSLYSEGKIICDENDFIQVDIALVEE